MKLKIYNKKRENILYLKLSEEDDEVMLDVVDINGNLVSGGALLSICPKGLHLRSAINANIGFPLDKKNKLLVI